MSKARSGRLRALSPSEELEDAALRLAAADPRNGWSMRAFAWFAWAYNRSVLHEVWSLVDVLTLSGNMPGGPLMSLWRRLAYWRLPQEHTDEYLNAAGAAPYRYSGFSGALLVLALWTLVLLLFCWTVITFFP